MTDAAAEKIILSYTTIVRGVRTNKKVHHLIRHIGDPFPGSYAYLSESEQTDTAVVFVHGFLGHARETWLHFQTMMDTCSDAYPWWKVCDAYFFQYSSIHKAIYDISARLLDFIDFCFPLPNDELFSIQVPWDPSIRVRVCQGARRYRDLVLVGHSLGAVVIRRAVVARCKAGRQTIEKEGHLIVADNYQLLNAKVRLFAPAHIGACPSGVIGAVVALAKSTRLTNAILHLPTTVVDIHETNVIRDVKADTEALLKEFPWLESLRARCLFGENDRIVVKGEFLGDIPEPPVPNHDHMSICKPSPGYEKPLEFVSVRKVRAASNV